MRSAAVLPSIEAREELVELTLRLAVERRLVGWRLVVRPARAAPSPHTPGDEDCADDEAGDRQPPGKEVEALSGRRGKDARAEVLHEISLDLAFGLALRDQDVDAVLDASSGGRIRLVECRVAGRAHYLALHRGERRLRARCRRGACEDESSKRDRCSARDHDCTALRSARSNRARNTLPLTGPARCSSTFPFRSSTKVSGTCVIPYRVSVTSPDPS